MEGWSECLKPHLWWTALEETGVDIERTLHEPVAPTDPPPWDHVNVRKGRAYLEKEQNRAVVQLEAMADAE